MQNANRLSDMSSGNLEVPLEVSPKLHKGNSSLPQRAQLAATCYFHTLQHPSYDLFSCLYLAAEEQHTASNGWTGQRMNTVDQGRSVVEGSLQKKTRAQPVMRLLVSCINADYESNANDERVCKR